MLGRLTWGRSVEAASGRSYIFVTRLRQPVLPRPDAFSPARLIVSILIAGLVCYFLALYLTNPVKKLRSTVKAFAEGNLEARVSPKLGNRADELANLAVSLIKWPSGLKASSHRSSACWRTSHMSCALPWRASRWHWSWRASRPKAASALNRIEQETERVNQLVGQLLTLTKLESGSERVPPEIVVLEEIVHQVIDDADYEAKPLHKSVTASELEHCRVRGSVELLRSAIENWSVMQSAIPPKALAWKWPCTGAWRLPCSRCAITVRAFLSQSCNNFEPFYRVSERGNGRAAAWAWVSRSPIGP